LFNRVDNFIDEDNNYELARMIYESLDQLHNANIDDFMSTSIPISIIASIVCNQDEDIIYDKTGDVLLESNSIVFSDELDDIIYEGRVDLAKELIESELITRERYELLNEMKKYERNS